MRPTRSARDGRFGSVWAVPSPVPSDPFKQPQRTVTTTLPTARRWPRWLIASAAFSSG